LGYKVIIFQAASSAGVSPLRLSFTGTLRVIRRALPKFQRLQPQELPFFELVNLGYLAQIIPERVQRNNPRVVKKPVSKFRSKQVNTEVLES
jgi:hypothetical protein